MIDERWKNYRLRTLCGASYLVCVAQSGRPYQKPVELNGSAAHIIGELMSGRDAAGVASEIAAGEPGISEEQILSDIESLVSQIFTEN